MANGCVPAVQGRYRRGREAAPGERAGVGKKAGAGAAGEGYRLRSRGEGAANYHYVQGRGGRSVKALGKLGKARGVGLGCCVRKVTVKTGSSFGGGKSNVVAGGV